MTDMGMTEPMTEPTTDGLRAALDARREGRFCNACIDVPCQWADRDNRASAGGLRDIEWLVWFARKSKGTVEEVARRAIEQNPYLRDHSDSGDPESET